MCVRVCVCVCVCVCVLRVLCVCVCVYSVCRGTEPARSGHSLSLSPHLETRKPNVSLKQGGAALQIFSDDNFWRVDDQQTVYASWLFVMK